MNAHSYHANLQEAAKEELRHAPSIRRKYGYVLDLDGLEKGKFIKRREYLRIEHLDHVHLSPDAIYQIPAGKYIIFNLQINHEEADFSPLLNWIAKYGKEIDAVFAEELGLQLFRSLLL